MNSNPCSTPTSASARVNEQPIYWKAVAVLAANALPRDPREKRRQRLLFRYFIIGCEAPSYGLLCFKLNSQV